MNSERRRHRYREGRGSARSVVGIQERGELCTEMSCGVALANSKSAREVTPKVTNWELCPLMGMRKEIVANMRKGNHEN
jgi:hypothetical protein